MFGVVVGAVLLGCVAFLATDLSRAACARITRFEDGPPSSQPLVPILVGASALLGGLLVYLGMGPLELAVVAVAVFALAACWCSDAICGILPDVFTLAPLALLVAFGIVRGDWWSVGSALMLFVPFAVASYFTKGKGMGWGDTKLAAVVGAALGGPLGFIAMALACVAAAVGYKLKGIQSGPIALAPYIAGAVALTLPLSIIR